MKFLRWIGIVLLGLVILLAKKEPEKTKEMLALWKEYVAQNGVILTGDGPFAKREP